ncbi:hypothetical protein PBV87_20485 [Niameybacter massiliensis]|uniref:Uncharacterized protein n=1 Tax=Holtiella tumoricola TaxID=3018743 RepID=A0AA42DRJ1_9FIRM|nr:hypothetical protein [Holtiella tumoricola]MDA3733855.1 hypothetical protein [Holtiella tumoricola]
MREKKYNAENLRSIPMLPTMRNRGSETVLLIQDNVPWRASADNPLGADVAELTAQGKKYCIIGSSKLETTDLSQYSAIVIPSAQTQGFYDRIFPAGTVHSKLDEFVKHGGVLSANLADGGSGEGYGGKWADYTFIAGVQHVEEYSSDNKIADSTHPIIAAIAPCVGGNCGLIVDFGNYNDLDGWKHASHGYFTNLPVGTKVILTDANNQPVMIEYMYGKGVVIATLTTVEWRYVGGTGRLPQNKKLLANEFAYQDYLVEKRKPYIPTEGDVDLAIETIQCPWNLEQEIEVQGEVKVFVEKYKHSEGDCQGMKPGKGDDIAFTLVFGNYGEFAYVAPASKPTLNDTLKVKAPVNLKLMTLHLAADYKLYYGNTSKEVRVGDVLYGAIGSYKLQLRKYDTTANDYVADFDLPPHYIGCISMLYQIEF